MNLLLQLTIRGAVMLAVVFLCDWWFAVRISTRTRRPWWLLVPFAFFLTVPLAVLPNSPAAVVSKPPSLLDQPPAGAVVFQDVERSSIAGPQLDTSIHFPWRLVVAFGAAAYLTVVLARTHLAMRRWKRERLCTDPALLGELEDCKATAKITAPIGLVVSEAVSAPVILGWLRPKILLPRTLVTALSREQLRAVLFHELAHFRSLDIPCSWLFTMACALHWFNPAAHLALRAWARFREEAADETAIGWLGQSSGMAYGETLLHVLRTLNGPAPTPFTALAVVESVGQLSKRITMIKHYKYKSPNFLLTGTVFLAAAAGILLRPVHAQDSQPIDPSPAPTARDATQKMPVAKTPEEKAYLHWCVLGQAAKTSLDQGEEQAAKAMAEELERLTPQYPKDWNYGNAVQDANVVLGRLALKANDVEAAKTRLLAAGRSPGSPQMNSFGPNVTLAKDLLAKGEKAVVLDYFELCRKFWKMENGRLDQWKADVQADRVPDFGANLAY